MLARFGRQTTISTMPVAPGRPACLQPKPLLPATQRQRPACAVGGPKPCRPLSRLYGGEGNEPPDLYQHPILPVRAHGTRSAPPHFSRYRRGPIARALQGHARGVVQDSRAYARPEGSIRASPRLPRPAAPQQREWRVAGSHLQTCAPPTSHRPGQALARWGQTTPPPALRPSAKLPARPQKALRRAAKRLASPKDQHAIQAGLQTRGNLPGAMRSIPAPLPLGPPPAPRSSPSLLDVCQASPAREALPGPSSQRPGANASVWQIPPPGTSALPRPHNRRRRSSRALTHAPRRGGCSGGGPACR